MSPECRRYRTKCCHVTKARDFCGVFMSDDPYEDDSIHPEGYQENEDDRDMFISSDSNIIPRNIYLVSNIFNS